MDTSSPRFAQVGMTRHLNSAQWKMLTDAFENVETHEAGTLVSDRGELLNTSLLLIEGIIARQIPKPKAERNRLVALQVPGDFVDLHGYPMKRLDHNVLAMTDVRLAVVRHDVLKALLDSDAELTRVLWSLTLVDASIHRHWAYRNGGMRAMARVADFFAEIDARLHAAGLNSGDRFTLAMTQEDVADACGLSSVHLNRVLRDLREAGCLRFRDGVVHVMDRDMMLHTARYDPAYLYLP